MKTPQDIGDCDGIMCHDCGYRPEKLDVLRTDLGCEMRTKFLLEFNEMMRRIGGI